MSLVGEQILLRAYLRNADRAPHTPTWQRLVRAARVQRLAGATVLKGVMGYGARGVIKPSTWTLTEHAPVIVEVVDAPAKIASFVDGPVQEIMRGGMLTLERAAVMMYRHRYQDRPGPLHLAAPLPPLSTVPELSRPVMSIAQKSILLRVFIGESDKIDARPMHEAILQRARELGLAGATVLRGIEGFGAHSVVHKAHLLDMSTDLPIVIEIVDDETKVNLLLPYLEQVVKEGMVTMEHVLVVNKKPVSPS